MNPLAGIAGLVVLFGVVVQVSALHLALILPNLILCFSFLYTKLRRDMWAFIFEEVDMVFNSMGFRHTQPLPVK